MKKRKLKTYKFGDEMLTADEIAKRLGTSRGTVYSRMAHGVPLEKDINSKRRYHDYKGEKYTWAQLAEIAGCPKSTLKSRVQKGMSIEKAVELGARNARFNHFGNRDKILEAWDGGRRTIAEVMKITGCTRRQINLFINVKDVEKMEVLQKYGYM